MLFRSRFRSNLLGQFFNLGVGSFQTDIDLIDIPLINEKSGLMIASNKIIITYIIFTQLVFICTHLGLNLCLPRVEMVRAF